MKLKKILIIVAVIIGGLMLGTIFSLSLPSSDKNQGNVFQNFQGKSSTSSNNLDVRVSADPSVIQSIGETRDVNQLPVTQQSLVSVTYTNNTSSDLTNVELWASGTGANFGFSGTKDATYDQDSKVENIKYSIFKVKDLKKGQSGTSILYFFSREPGNIKLDIAVKTKEGKNSNTSTTSITAN